MIRYRALVLLPMLIACSPSPPATTPQARCQQQVDSDAAVKALLVQAPARSADPRWQADLADARRQSVTVCLTAAGLAPRGGVEPVARARYGLGWF
jgi:hypothetical protein